MGYRVKIQETNRGQKIINIPKVISSLFDIKKGMECEWVLNKGNLILKIVKNSALQNSLR